MQMIVHPDYIIDETARRVYADLLSYLCELRAAGKTWIALPAEIASWWRTRAGLSLVKEGVSWEIRGEGHERACVAHATLIYGKLVYEFDRTLEDRESA